ncbi:hypothetical protein ACFX5U_08610 [Sphingobacterium sp. SG20118]|uniref:hypothetical protein n=1 Tax=Sphingobacterium sp. SG20118 TaxID=3367156 RepID=UPI0037DFC05E
MFEEIKEKAPSEIVQYFIYELRLMTTLLDELKFSNLYFVQSEIDILDKELQPQIRKIYELSAEIKSKLIK